MVPSGRMVKTSAAYPDPARRCRPYTGLMIRSISSGPKATRTRCAAFASLCATSALIAGTGAIPLFAQNMPASKESTHRIRVELIGDSTQTDNAGYGRGFCANLTNAVDCINMAHGGASTKTFRADGYWDKALALKPDYMLIQFGHNDMPGPDHNPRQTTVEEYEANLRRFVAEARAAGAQPVLVTPIARRYYGSDGKIHSDLLTHAAITLRVAQSLHVPTIDLQAESIAYLDKVGPVEGPKLGITKKDNDGKTIPDKTHLNWQGSYIFGRIVVVDLGKAVPALAPFVKPQPATLPEEGRVAMRIFEQQPFKAVVLSSGWGPGLCAVFTHNVTCVPVNTDGETANALLASGAWKSALSEHAQVYFIEAGETSPAHADAASSVIESLRRMVADVRAVGAIPVLVTAPAPASRADADAVRKIATEMKVTVTDLNAMSRRLAAADGTAPAPAVLGRLVADDVIRTEVELGPDVVGVPANAQLKKADTTPAPTDGH